MNEIEYLKGRGRHFHAGALAASLGHDDTYGCHYGLRSTREDAIREFKRGHAEATEAIKTNAREAAR